MRICVLYAISPTQREKYNNWKDGFTTALDILSKKYDIDMINTIDNITIDFSPYDVVIFKEGFDARMYKKYGKSAQNKIKALCISTSKRIPTDQILQNYDIIFYETEWYYKYANLSRHSHAYHAFGVDTDTMRPIKDCKKVYDVIFVGAITNYKRPLKLLEIDGDKKICLGAIIDIKLAQKLKANKIDVINFVPYVDLVHYYNKSKLCYIPTMTHGGGERAVLEARSCGIPIKIESDNLKLSELVNSEIYSSRYYAGQLEKGIHKWLLQKITKNTFSDVLKSVYDKHINILEIGGMDGKTFDPIYPHIIKNKKWNLVVLEPIKAQFQKLEKNYVDYNNITCVNKALNYTTDDAVMHTIDMSTASDKKPYWMNGISSFYNNRNSIEIGRAHV